MWQIKLVYDFVFPEKSVPIAGGLAVVICAYQLPKNIVAMRLKGLVGWRDVHPERRFFFDCDKHGLRIFAVGLFVCLGIHHRLKIIAVFHR